MRVYNQIDITLTVTHLRICYRIEKHTIFLFYYRQRT